LGFDESYRTHSYFIKDWHEGREDIPYQNATQFLEVLFQIGLQPREAAKAERLIKKKSSYTRSCLSHPLEREDSCPFSYDSRRDLPVRIHST